MNKTLKAALVMTGVTSIIAQVVLIRELMVVFYGTELCIGIILAAWLLWEAFGATVAGRILKKINNPLILFVLIQAILSIIIPASTLAIKLTGSILNIGAGEMFGIIPTIYVPALILAPVCILLGLQFSLGCKLYSVNSINSASFNISKVYVYEATGWAIGSLLFTFILAYFLNNFHIALLSGIISIFIVVLLSFSGKKRILGVVNMLFLLSYIAFIAVPAGRNLYTRVLDKQWPESFKLLDSRDSVYGNVTVRKRAGQFSFYHNGVLSFSSDDRLHNEEIVHLPLLRFPTVSNVLVVGGGLSGILDEILRYPEIEKVWYAEIDPMLLRLGKKHLHPPALGDKRIKTIATDGRFFIKSMEGSNLDSIIINLPDPSTAQLNRFYTLEFFEEAKRALQPSGILTISISSSQDYISNEMKEFNGSVLKTMKMVFDNVTLIPGETAFFIASHDRYLPVTKEFLALNLLYLPKRPRYITTDYLYSRLAPSRIGYVNNRLSEDKDIRINSDLNPISYYHNTALWVSSYHPELKILFNFIKNNITFANMLVLLILSGLIALLVTIRSKNKFSCLYTALVTGFAGMSCEIILLIMFQSFYGSIYSRIGILTAGYMLGMALGSMKMRKIGTAPGLFLKRTVLKLFLFICLLPIVFRGLMLIQNQSLTFLVAQAVFPILTFIVGYFSGAVFSLSNSICLGNTQGDRLELNQAGIVYGMDLLGAALGALVTGILLIPLLGIMQSCIIISITVGITYLVLRSE